MGNFHAHALNKTKNADANQWHDVILHLSPGILIKGVLLPLCWLSNVSTEN